MKSLAHEKLYNTLKKARENRKWFTRVQDNAPNPDLLVTVQENLRVLANSPRLNHKEQSE